MGDGQRSRMPVGELWGRREEQSATSLQMGSMFPLNYVLVQKGKKGGNAAVIPHKSLANPVTWLSMEQNCLWLIIS